MSEQKVPYIINDKYKYRKSVNGGKRADLGNMYFRSSWEANYARYLNFLKKNGSIVNWEYEPDTFEFENIKRGTRFYTPDFKIWLINGYVEYHEIKGYMDTKSKTRHKRMSKYFPDVKIEMIDKDRYSILQKQLKNIIPNWECENKHKINNHERHITTGFSDD